jgi:two-component system response regulator PilR (NtrC family)
MLAVLEKALEKRALVGREPRAPGRGRGQTRTASSAAATPCSACFELVRRVAMPRTSVLITGESGTGKEVVARALHFTARSAQAPFVVAVNCGAIPETLMESELFGHDEGGVHGRARHAKSACSSAATPRHALPRRGRRAAPGLQVKLLRVLQERKVRPVGRGSESRWTCASSPPPTTTSRRRCGVAGFREDLYYRLNVIRIELPPLRDRPDDIPPLARHLLRKHALLQRRDLRLSADALRWLAAQPYPGNVRQLENVIERAVAFASGSTVSFEDLPHDLAATRSDEATGPELPALGEEGLDIDAWLSELERAMVIKALDATGGRQKAAARLLHTSFHSFRYRLRKYGLAADDNEGPR